MIAYFTDDLVKLAYVNQLFNNKIEVYGYVTKYEAGLLFEQYALGFQYIPSYVDGKIGWAKKITLENMEILNVNGKRLIMVTLPENESTC